MPLFSVIVPTYDRPALLSEALASVMAQTEGDFECIVVEDAPPVSSAELPPDSRFRLIRHERNQGVAAARNTGLANAQGTFVTFLDDDDVYTPDRLALVRPLLPSDDRVVVCGRAGLLSGQSHHHRDLQGDVRDTVADGFTPHLGQTTLRRDRCPEFSRRYPAMQDVEWWLRLAHQLPVLSTPEIGYLMRRHPGERHGNGKEVRAACSRQLLDDYHEYFHTHRRARAFRLERLARLEASLGHRDKARSAAWQSVRALPRLRTLALATALSTPRSARPGRSGQDMEWDG